MSCKNIKICLTLNQELRKHQIHLLRCSAAPKVKCNHCHKYIFESRMAEHTQKHLMQEVVSGMVQMSSGAVTAESRDNTEEGSVV